jgi:hypothetical protein
VKVLRENNTEGTSGVLAKITAVPGRVSAIKFIEARAKHAQIHTSRRGGAVCGDHRKLRACRLVFVLGICTGSDPRHACKENEYCKHCAKEGGKCGVCK